MKYLLIVVLFIYNFNAYSSDDIITQFESICVEHKNPENCRALILLQFGKTFGLTHDFNAYSSDDIITQFESICVEYKNPENCRALILLQFGKTFGLTHDFSAGTSGTYDSVMDYQPPNESPDLLPISPQQMEELRQLYMDDNF